MRTNARSPRVLAAPRRPLRADGRGVAPAQPPRAKRFARERIVRAFDGTRLYARAQGAGMPILFVGGPGCDGHVFGTLMPALARTRQVIYWHPRAHGRSQVPLDLDTLCVDGLVRDVASVLDAFELERAVLVGHSLGAKVVLEAAARMPERTLGLVSLCGLWEPRFGGVAGALLRGALARALRVAEREPSAARRVWRSLVDTASAVVGPGSEAYLGGLAALDPRFFARLAVDMEGHTLGARLAQVRAPSLVVAGARDLVSPVALARRLRLALADAELSVVPGAGHGCPLGAAGTVHSRVEQFLASTKLAGNNARLAPVVPLRSHSSHASPARGVVELHGAPRARRAGGARVQAHVRGLAESTL